MTHPARTFLFMACNTISHVARQEIPWVEFLPPRLLIHTADICDTKLISQKKSRCESCGKAANRGYGSRYLSSFLTSRVAFHSFFIHGVHCDITKHDGIWARRGESSRNLVSRGSQNVEQPLCGCQHQTTPSFLLLGGKNYGIGEGAHWSRQSRCQRQHGWA